MKFASKLPAKVWILLFLGIAATSAFYGKQYHARVPSLTEELKKVEKSVEDLKKGGQALSANLHPDSSRIEMSTELSNVLLAIMDNRIRYGIHVSNIAPHKNASTNVNSAEFSQLAEDVPGGSLPSVRLNIRGSYRSYEGLVGYMDALRTHPAAIVYLKVEGSAFEMGLRVYGNK